MLYSTSHPAAIAVVADVNSTTSHTAAAAAAVADVISTTSHTAAAAAAAAAGVPAAAAAAGFPAADDALHTKHPCRLPKQAVSGVQLVNIQPRFCMSCLVQLTLQVGFPMQCLMLMRPMNPLMFVLSVYLELYLAWSHQRERRQ